MSGRAKSACKDLGSTLSLYQRSHDVEGHSTLHFALIFQTVAGDSGRAHGTASLVVDLTSGQ